jgi:hypothetical protein
MAARAAPDIAQHAAQRAAPDTAAERPPADALQAQQAGAPAPDGRFGAPAGSVILGESQVRAHLSPDKFIIARLYAN